MDESKLITIKDVLMMLVMVLPCLACIAASVILAINGVGWWGAVFACAFLVKPEMSFHKTTETKKDDKPS